MVVAFYSLSEMSSAAMPYCKGLAVHPASPFLFTENDNDE